MKIEDNYDLGDILYLETQPEIMLDSKDKVFVSKRTRLISAFNCVTLINSAYFLSAYFSGDSTLSQAYLGILSSLTSISAGILSAIKDNHQNKPKIKSLETQLENINNV